MSRKPVVYLAVTAVIAGAAVGGRTAFADGGPSLGGRANGTSARTGSPVEDVIAHFSSLRGQGEPASALGAKAAKATRVMLPGGAFTVHTLADGKQYKYYVLVAGDGLCTVDVDHGSAGGGCVPEMARADASAYIHPNGPDVTYLGKAGYRIAMLLPDGASTVELKWADGRDRHVELRNNLANALVEELPARVTWTRADGVAASARVPKMPRRVPPSKTVPARTASASGSS